MAERYLDQKDDPVSQAINSKKQADDREQYRRNIADDPDRNTGLPGFENPAEESQKNGPWHKSSQDPAMLQKDDQFLDDDNNMRKDADVNRDQNK